MRDTGASRDQLSVRLGGRVDVCAVPSTCSALVVRNLTTLTERAAALVNPLAGRAAVLVSWRNSGVTTAGRSTRRCGLRRTATRQRWRRCSRSAPRVPERAGRSSPSSGSSPTATSTRCSTRSPTTTATTARSTRCRSTPRIRSSRTTRQPSRRRTNSSWSRRTAAEAAGEFLQWLTQPAQQRRWHEETGYFPVHEDAVARLRSDGWFEENPHYGTAIDQLLTTTDTTATRGAQIGPFESVRTAVEEGFERMETVEDVPETLARVTEGVESLLDAYEDGE